MNQYQIKIALYTVMTENAELLPEISFANVTPSEDLRNKTEPFLMCYDMPRNSERHGLNGVDDLGGILRVIVSVPTGGGEISGAKIAQTVLDLFPPGQVSGKLRVSRPGWIGPGLDDAGRYEIPVSIPYRCIN